MARQSLPDSVMSGYRPKGRLDSESQPLLSSDISRRTSEWGAFKEDQDVYADFTPLRFHRMDPIPTKAQERVVRVTRQSSVVTIFAIWNTMMGTSLLAMPWGMEKSGLLVGPLLITILGALCLYTAYLNLKAERQFGTPAGEIADLTRTLLGPTAEAFAKVFSFVVLLGANIVYWILMCNFLYYSVNYLTSLAGGRPNDDTVFNVSTGGVICPTNQVPASNVTTTSTYAYIWDLNNTVPIFLALIIAPLLNFKSPTFFTKFNSFGTLSVMYLLLFVIVKSIIWGVNIDTTDATSMNYAPFYVSSFPAMSGMLALSFFIHNIIIAVMRSNANQKNNGRDLTIAYFLVMATYLIIGAVFYIGFPLAKSCINDNFLNNFASWDYMTIAARIFLLFQLVTVFPLITYMLRVQTMVALLGDPYPSKVHVLLFNTFIVVVCVLFAIFLPRIGTIIRFTGAISGLVHVFTIPCLLRLAVLKKQGKISLFSWIIYLTIPIYGGANLIGQFFVNDF